MPELEPRVKVTRNIKDENFKYKGKDYSHTWAGSPPVRGRVQEKSGKGDFLDPVQVSQFGKVTEFD